MTEETPVQKGDISQPLDPRIMHQYRIVPPLDGGVIDGKSPLDGVSHEAVIQMTDVLNGKQ